MARIRQYIGARYVPKFMGEYVDTQEYEALCVVDNGLGTSYISKIPTPAGTPLTDTTYWKLYGSSSGAVIDLQNQINDMKDGEVEGSLQNQINGLDANLDSLGDDVTALEGDVEDIVNYLGENKRIVVITDSYGLSHGGDPFTVPLQTYLGLSNSDYFAYAEGSLGFNQAGLSGHTAEQLLTLHAEDITNHNTITHVLFVIGGNDIDHQSGLETAMSSCFSYVKATYPNAKIVVAYSYNQLTKVPSYVVKYYQCIQNYIKYANKLGVEWVNNYPYIMHDADNFYTDGVHPNGAGGEALAQGLVAYFKNGQCDVKRIKECTYSSVNGTYTNTFRLMIDNECASICGTVRVEAVSLAGGANDVKVGAISSPLFTGTGLAFFIPSRVMTNSGAVIPVMVYIFEGDVYLTCTSATSDTINAGTNIPIGTSVQTLNI